MLPVPDGPSSITKPCILTKTKHCYASYCHLSNKCEESKRKYGFLNLQITECYRMFGVGRDLCGSPRAGCTGPCPGGSGISPEKETPQPPSAAWARAPSPSRGKKFFLVFSWSFLCFSLCPLPLVLSLGTTGKSLTPSF